jgi:flagellar basal body-associated protein FliL
MAIVKDKKVLIGVGLLVAALFWFYIKPTYLAAAPAVPPTAEQIAAAHRPTIWLGQPADPKAAAAWQGLKMNLKSTADSPHYALAIIALEFEDPKHTYVGVTATAALAAKNAKFADDLAPYMDKMLDATTGIFAGTSAEDAASPEGQTKLKQALMDAINAQLPDQKVSNVYFPTLITQ